MARKERIEPGIYRRGDTYLVAAYAGKDATTGAKKCRWVTAATLEEARRLRRRLQEETEKAGRIPPHRMTFGDMVWGRWWEEVRHARKPKTRRGYESILTHHLAPKDGGGLAKVRLDRLNREHITDYLARKRKAKLSETTLLHHFRLLHSILAWAKQAGYLADNPADRVTPPKPPKYRATRLLPEQAQALLDYLRQAGSYLHPIVAVALGTGARISELLALSWADVDMARRRLHVQRALAEESVRNGPVYGTPKDDEGRSVPMAEIVRDALWDRSLQVQEERRFYGQDYRDHGLVFARPDGRSRDPRKVSSDFGKAIQKANEAIAKRAAEQGREPTPEERIPHIRFHDLRHACATFLLKQGVHPKIVQEILGHSRIEVTLDLYSDVLPGVDEQAVRKLDSLLRTAPPAQG